MKYADPQQFGAVLSGNGSSETENRTSVDLHVRVAELAYLLYEQRGRQDGRDVEDWIQAEQTVLASQNHAATRAEVKSAKAVKSKRPGNAKTK